METEPMTQPADDEDPVAAEPSVAPNGVGAAPPEPPPDVPPTVAAAEKENARIRTNVDRKAQGEKRTGFLSHTADQKWDAELLPYLREKLGLEPSGVRIDVYLIDPPARGGGPSHVGYFYGSDVEGQAGKGAGAAFVDYMQDNIHLPLNKGACRYKVIFRKVQGGHAIGDGEQSFGTPEEIEAVRRAQRSARDGKQHRPAYQPYPSAGPPPPPPAFAAPGGPPYASSPSQGGGPAGPPSSETEHLRHEVNDLRVMLAKALGRLEAHGEVPAGTAAQVAAGAAPPPEPPITAKTVAEAFSAILDERDKRAREYAAANPPPPPPRQEGGLGRAPSTPGSRLREFVQDLRDYKTAMHEFRQVVQEEIGGDGVEHHAIPMEPGEEIPSPKPEEPDPIPFTVEEIPGSNFKGERVRWVATKPGRRMDFLEGILAWASANPGITENVAGKVMDVVEKVANATTIDAQGNASPAGGGDTGGGGWGQ
jgi:hypothetical protein